jgi:hypothetical protein
LGFEAVSTETCLCPSDAGVKRDEKAEAHPLAGLALAGILVF